MKGQFPSGTTMRVAAYDIAKMLLAKDFIKEPTVVSALEGLVTEDEFEPMYGKMCATFEKGIKTFHLFDRKLNKNVLSMSCRKRSLVKDISPS